MPFLALTVLHYGNLWGLFFLISAAPMFMSEVLGFNLAQAGILASLPYLARLFAGFAFGALGDVIRKKQLMHVTTVRKFFCIFCEFLYMVLFRRGNLEEKICICELFAWHFMRPHIYV